MAQLTTAAVAEELRADFLVKRLFAKASHINSTEQVTRAATSRVERGDPPGKRGLLGDAINWESLLAGVPQCKPLHFVSGDGDYSSPLDRDRLLPVLALEWSETKGSEISFYRLLSQFFAENLPRIALSDEGEKAKLIGQLAASNSFAETHVIVAKLGALTDFNVPQAENLLSAMEANRQVRWIIGDADVSGLAYRILAEHARGDLNEALVQKIHTLLLGETTAPEECDAEAEDFPF